MGAVQLIHVPSDFSRAIREIFEAIDRLRKKEDVCSLLLCDCGPQ